MRCWSSGWSLGSCAYKTSPFPLSLIPSPDLHFSNLILWPAFLKYSWQTWKQLICMTFFSWGRVDSGWSSKCNADVISKVTLILRLSCWTSVRMPFDKFSKVWIQSFLKSCYLLSPVSLSLCLLSWKQGTFCRTSLPMITDGEKQYCVLGTLPKNFWESTCLWGRSKACTSIRGKTWCIVYQEEKNLL